MVVRGYLHRHFTAIVANYRLAHLLERAVALGDTRGVLPLPVAEVKGTNEWPSVPQYPVRPRAPTVDCGSSSSRLWVLPAVCEEFFFRGAFQQILQRWFGNMHVAVVATSVVFAVAHGDVYGLMPRFILGLLLGYLFTLSGSIVVNICAHFFNNTMVVLLYYLFRRQQIYLDPTEPLFFSWSTTIICGLTALMLFILYFTKIITKETTK